jgi:xylulokinase
VLLIGGAGANRAVQISAAQIFGVDVVIPDPGEYVADGAARQASLALKGIPAGWQLGIQGSVAADSKPEILTQYHAARDSIYKI